MKIKEANNLEELKQAYAEQAKAFQDGIISFDDYHQMRMEFYARVDELFPRPAKKRCV